MYVMINFYKSVLMKKQTYLHLEWPEGECIFSTFSVLGGAILLQPRPTHTYKLLNNGWSCVKLVFIATILGTRALTTEDLQ